MKLIFSTKPRNTTVSFSLLVLRLGVGALMLTHGWPKLLRLIEGGDIKFADPLGIGVVLSLVSATLTEVLGSALIMLGLGTRLASLSLAFTMAVAIFMVHANDPFARKELGLIYLLIYVVLLFTGSGRFSLDRFIR